MNDEKEEPGAATLDARAICRELAALRKSIDAYSAQRQAEFERGHDLLASRMAAQEDDGWPENSARCAASNEVGPCDAPVRPYVDGLKIMGECRFGHEFPWDERRGIH